MGASFDREITGFGGIFWSSMAEVVGPFSNSSTVSFNSFTAACLAIREGLVFAKMYCLPVDVVESDCVFAIKALTNETPPVSVDTTMANTRSLLV